MLVALPQCSTALAEEGSQEAAEGGDDSIRVFVLDAPYLEWEDITEATTPNLYSVLGDSAMGNLISRSSNRSSDTTPSVDEAAASISRGTWQEDPESLDIDDVETSYSAASDGLVTSEYVAYDGGTAYGGKLGEVLEEEGWLSGAIGCSDYSSRTVRPAAITVSDADGYVWFSTTDSDELLEQTDGLPYQTTDLEKLDEGLSQILEGMDAYAEAKDASGNAVIAVDSGDLYRAGTYRIESGDEAASSYWSQAVASFDDTVGLVLDKMDGNDILIVYSTLAETTTESLSDDGYGPLIVYGGGYSGLLCTSSTGRDGLVTAIDLTATLVSLTGHEPSFENATVLYGEAVSESTTVEGLLDSLEYESDMADAIADSQVAAVALLVVVLVAAFACSVVMLSPKIKLPMRLADIMIIVTRLLWLGAAAAPVATYLMIGVMPHDPTTVQAVLICAAITIALTLLAIVIGKLSGRWLYSLIFLMLLTVVVIAVDQLTGAQLARVGYLTYIPEKLGRFSGIGNEGACVLFAAWMMSSGLILNRFPNSRRSQIFAKVLFPVLSALLLAIIIAPWWGANFGAMVWGVVGVFAAWWMFTGHRLSWKVILLTMIGCVGLVILLILADSAGGQSHLGLTGAKLMSDGIAYLPVIVRNMLRLSLATLYASPLLSVALAFIWLYLAWMRIEKPGPYETFWSRNQYFKSTFTACMVVAVVMLLVEDSGILLPALTLLYCTAGLTWLICDLHRWEFKELEKEQGLIDEDIEPPVGSFKIEEDPETKGWEAHP